MPFAATWMQLEIITLSKSDRERQISYHLYVGSKKKIIQMNLFTKQKQTHREQIYGYQGKGGGEINQESGMDMYTQRYLKWDIQQRMTVQHR